MAILKRVFCFGTNTFDSSHRFETSWLFTPWVLFALRALFCLYTFTVQIFTLIWVGVQPSYGGPEAASLSFSFFTILTYWGIAFYFLFASIHTFGYARSGTPLISRFPRPLQALHSLFYTTITTYPFIVTVIYWVVLFNDWWVQPYRQWSNISQHGLNSAFALFEIIFPRTNIAPWVHLLYLIIILAMYLGLAYLTHYTRGVYVYPFLDPSDGKGKLIGYIFGILAACIVVFALRQGLVWLRKWVTEVKMDREGKFHGGRSKAQGDVEFESARHWEK